MSSLVLSDQVSPSATAGVVWQFTPEFSRIHLLMQDHLVSMAFVAHEVYEVLFVIVAIPQLSDGEIQDGDAAGRLVGPQGVRQKPHMPRVASIPISSRVTITSSHGNDRSTERDSTWKFELDTASRDILDSFYAFA